MCMHVDNKLSMRPLVINPKATTTPTQPHPYTAPLRTTKQESPFLCS